MKSIQNLYVLALVVVLVVAARSDPIPPTTTPSTPQIITSCSLQNSSINENHLLDRINIMKGAKYECEDKEHKYYFSICTTADHANGEINAGLVQMNMEKNTTYVIGRLNNVDLEGLENFIRMSYNDGDEYAHACNRNKRSAIIYFVCDPNQKADNFTLIEENNEREKGCAYVFELKTSKICLEHSNDNTTTTTTTTTTSTTTTTTKSTTTSSNKSTTSSNSSVTTTTSSSDSSAHKASSGLGVFPILAICGAALFLTYMIVGTLYLRFVNQARGWEQIPHLTMWRSVGDRFATCCNSLCGRCGQQQAQVHSYENINDRISDDENLLNM